MTAQALCERQAGRQAMQSKADRIEQSRAEQASWAEGAGQVCAYSDVWACVEHRSAIQQIDANEDLKDLGDQTVVNNDHKHKASLNALIELKIEQPRPNTVD